MDGHELHHLWSKFFGIIQLKSPICILMAVFLWDEFEVLVIAWSILRALKYEGWSKKASKQKARERNAELRDAYFHFISGLSSYHFVYVDESGCDKRIGFRGTGWSPRGTTPSQVIKFHRDQRYQICSGRSCPIQCPSRLNRLLPFRRPI